jgi:hypothetical protein
VPRLAKIAPLVIAVCAALAAGASGQTQLPEPKLAIAFSFSSQPSFSVEHITQNSGSGLSVGVLVIGGQGPPPPARVAVDVPSQYSADLTAAPGSLVGIGFLTSAESSGQTLSQLTVFGAVAAADPAQYASDPAAQACATGPYLAVWRIDAVVLGFKLSLPIFLVHPAGSSTAIELRFCAPFPTTPDGKPATAAPLQIDSLELLLSDIAPPTAAGSYLWQAFVTPQTPGTGTPNDGSIYELRALVPLPHRLVVKGHFDAKAHAAVLTGAVTEVGKPQAHADVFVVTANGILPIHARTNAAGRFTIRAHVSQTTTFLVDVPDQTEACQGASTAPAGCQTETISAAGGKRVRVVVPSAQRR